MRHSRCIGFTRGGAALSAALACAGALASGVAIEVSGPGVPAFYLDEGTEFTFTSDKIHVTWEAGGGFDYTYRIEADNGPTIVAGLQIDNVPSSSTVTVNFVGGSTGIELEFVDYLRKGADFDGVLVLPNLFVRGYLAEVTANRAGNITVTDPVTSVWRGDLLGPVTLHAAGGSPALGDIEVDGSILGDITVQGNRTVGFIHAARFIGAEVNPGASCAVEPAPVFITTGGNTGTIRAWAIYAHIDVGTAAGSTDFDGIRTLGNEGDPFEPCDDPIVPGDFIGSLRARELQHNGGFTVIANDLDASIELIQPLVALIRVGRSFVERLEEIENEMVNVNGVILPANGLATQGQIVFNTSMSSSAVWESLVIVDTIELDEPEYAATAPSLGGGAVGMSVDPGDDVGYSMHDTSCVPHNGGVLLYGTLDISGFPPDCVYNTLPITLAFYGPLIVEDTPPLLIEYDDDFSGWINVTNDFNITLLGSLSHERRRIEIEDKGGTSGRWKLGDYRITPVAGRLTSRYLGEVNSEPEVNAFVYEIEVVDSCTMMLLQNFDFNEDDTLCELDLTAWTADPCDLNGDSVIDGDDVLLLMGAIDLYETLNGD